MTIQALKKQETYEHVGPKVTSTQDGKRSQDDEKRLCLADDLNEAQVHMQVKLKGTSSSLKSKDHYAYHKLKDKDSRPRAKTKDIRRIDVGAGFWFMLRSLSGMDVLPPRIEGAVAFLLPSSKGRSTRSVISRLVLAAMCYYIWQERNARLFKKNSKSSLLICETIITNVRLKLVSFRLKKNNARVREMIAIWKLPSSHVVYEDTGST
ncbi:hypothetical protein Tco_0537001 [Tanacetum coccineum]